MVHDALLPREGRVMQPRNPSVSDVAERMGVSERRVREWMRTGELWSYLPHGMKRGRRTTWAEVEKFMRECGTDKPM